MSNRAALLSLALPLAAAGLLLTPSAHAEVFQGEGWIFGAERTVGFGYESLTSTQTDTKRDIETKATASRTGFSLLGRRGQTAYSAPRLSVDYRLGSLPELTLGGSLTYDYGSAEVETQTTTPTSSSTDIEKRGSKSLFSFSPRAGWVIPVNDSVTFWPRAGFTIFNDGSSSEDGTETETLSGFGLNLEPTLVIGLSDHFGLHVGAALDVPLGGTYSQTTEVAGVKTTTEFDMTVLSLGLNAGLTAWL